VTAGRHVRLAFGRTGLDVLVPGEVDVLTPPHPTALAYPVGAVRRALREPAFGPSLDKVVPPGALVSVSVSDVTRPFPARTVLPLQLAELPGRRVRLVVATGSHRSCTQAELDRMFGADVLAASEVVQHDADADAEHVSKGAAFRRADRGSAGDMGRAHWQPGP
jgi:lactate racemase